VLIRRVPQFYYFPVPCSLFLIFPVFPILLFSRFSLFYYFRFLCFRFPILLFPVPWLPGYLHLFSVWFICLLRDFLFIPVYLSHYFNLAVYIPCLHWFWFFSFQSVIFFTFYDRLLILRVYIV